MADKKGLIQSLDRALDILEIVRDSNMAMRASNIAEKAGLGVATAHNIIRSLYRRGYLAQDENSRYLLGTECFKLYKDGWDRFDNLRKIVSNEVKKISEKTGDTTFFGCEYSGSLYCVSLSLGHGQLVVNINQDWLDLLHCTAAGKIILAEKGIDWFIKLCKKKPLKQLSPKTIVTVEKMGVEIEKIHRDGYSLSIDECAEGVAALGIAVYDSEGKFVGSLAQSFPTSYLQNGKVEPVKRAELLTESAKRISHEL
jgi:DNA-binding IclR family transcriptional regulator